MKSAGAVHRHHGEIGLRIRQDEQANPAHPHHPPGHRVRAILVAEHATNRAQHAAGQREASGQQRGHADVEPVLAHVVLHHPQRQRHIAAKHDAVVLAVLEHLGVLERLELVRKGDVAGNQVRGIAVAEQPKQDDRAQHDGGIHMWHGGPAECHQDHRSNELVDRGARVARTIHAHGHALAVLGKPARHIRRAH
ncbi:hypothetical protein SDC9_69876 [bioreactor metagenome]|uniref:Uncharacterized protein n=1 Tax=bioreactor metagenome TaxID=1076179 RepID=A0A644YB97_9ZZZZ